MNTDVAARRHGADPLLAPTGPPLRAADGATSNTDADLQARLASLATKRTATAPIAIDADRSAVTASRSRTRRRHAAKHSRAAALTFSALSTAGLGYLLAATDSGASAAPAQSAGIVAPQLVAASTPATPVPSAAPTPTSAPVTTARAPVQVNGQTFTNKWGPVQVRATFSPDGSLTAVDAVQTPYADGKSVGINNYAVPRLTSEALSAQSSQVDTISGATYTSTGYRQSLQSAIDIAVANGITTVGAGA